ncbi:scaffolding protein [Microbacterium phage Magritte]|nr:scaffolding protein [Microbacterium phage Magritte]
MSTDELAIIPAPKGDGFVELAATAAPPKAQGRVFRKQILKFGDLRYKNGRKYKIDEEFADKLIDNFSTSGEIVHVPKAGSRNEHNDDPDRNIGEVIGVVKDKNGIYADIDVRTDDADKLGKTLLGVSALLDLAHENRETGENIGPTLLHACVTNRPYVTNLEPFQELVGLSVDIPEDMIVLTDDETKEPEMATKEELIEALKSEHKIDVVALSAEVEELRPLKDEVQTLRPQAEAYVTLSSAVSETFQADDGVLALSATDATVEEYVASVTNAHDKIVSLSAEVETAQQEKADTEAEAEVEKLRLTGFILPKNVAAMTELRKKDKDLFEKLLPENPVIKLSVEEGEEPTEEPGTTYNDEIDRLVKLSNETSAASA